MKLHQSLGPSSSSKLGRQLCWVACLIVCASGWDFMKAHSFTRLCVHKVYQFHDHTFENSLARSRPPAFISWGTHGQIQIILGFFEGSRCSLPSVHSLLHVRSFGGRILYTEPVFVNLLRSPGIDSQPGGFLKRFQIRLWFRCSLHWRCRIQLNPCRLCFYLFNRLLICSGKSDFWFEAGKLVFSQRR